MIEFKNSTKRQLNKNKKTELKQKASESWMIILKLLFDYNVSLNEFFQKYQIILIIIYKTPENSTGRIHEHLERRGNIHFGLEIYHNFYHKIITVDKETYLKRYNYFEGWE
ncbi:hypothetical protein QUF74_10180 [Candidatus Halobeggiatoa sp. HSG11]|nr:hypothetical protein [Candidatus Halobeggiatoa sp. HSG11]